MIPLGFLKYSRFLVISGRKWARQNTGWVDTSCVWALEEEVWCWLSRGDVIFPGEKGPTSIYPEVSWLQDMVGVRVVSPYSLDGCEVRVD